MITSGPIFSLDPGDASTQLQIESSPAFTDDASKRFSRVSTASRSSGSPASWGPPNGAREIDPDWIAQLFTDTWSDATRGGRVLRPRLGIALRGTGTPKDSIFAPARDADEIVGLVVQYAFRDLLDRDDQEKERGERREAQQRVVSGGEHDAVH